DLIRAHVDPPGDDRFFRDDVLRVNELVQGPDLMNVIRSFTGGSGDIGQTIEATDEGGGTTARAPRRDEARSHWDRSLSLIDGIPYRASRVCSHFRSGGRADEITRRRLAAASWCRSGRARDRPGSAPSGPPPDRCARAERAVPGATRHTERPRPCA